MKKAVVCIADPHWSQADPDPAIYLNVNPGPNFATTLEVKIWGFFQCFGSGFVSFWASRIQILLFSCKTVERSQKMLSKLIFTTKFFFLKIKF
jgi:hypothetical protein